MEFSGNYSKAVLDKSQGRKRYEKPFDMTVNICGAEVHIATLRAEYAPDSGKNGKVEARIIISKGSSFTDEFWEQNGETISNFIVKHLNAM